MNGGKRKAGVLTLGLAYAFVLAWARSVASTDDHFTIWGNHSIYSHLGSVSWNNQYLVDWQPPLDATGVSVPKIKAHWSCCGLVYSDTSVNGFAVEQYWISYWYFISPLVLISAWLLLSRPSPARLTGDGKHENDESQR